ncbi:MAG TPA: BTAD domain-containing putative transcriptional regulator [Kutzneria sp.]
MSGTTALEVSGRKPRALLAVLALNAGRVVPTDTVIDVLWGEDPPGSARAGVHSYVSTLRRVLREDTIQRRPAGYELTVPPTDVDVHEFGALVTQARQDLAASRFGAADRGLEAALALWRGDPLGGVGGDWAEHERDRLQQLRQAAVEDRIEARLRLGHGPRLIPELTRLVADDPLRERARGQLMIALYQAGRQADALTEYETGRRLLIDELGVEPSPEFQAVHGQILRGKVPPPVTDAPQPEPTAVLPEPVRAAPQQLPSDLPDFTGRDEQVDRLVRRLTADASATRVSVIAGQPGAGKSSLAIHVAHLMREQYPDGQLYVNLRGVHTSSLDPTEVLARFLRALGVPAQAVPESLEERADLYRTMLSDRRVLVLLDDAADERQVRDLLPGGSGCAVLVTSRRRLPALAGATHVDIEVFAETEATALLESLVGPERIAQDPTAAADIVRLCGQLALAVRITGARLAARPQWPLRLLATRLRERHQLLDELSTGDLEVRGSLLLSYEGLTETDRRALRLLGWLGTMEFAAWFVAPLLDLTVPATERILERLADSYLLDTTMVDAAGSPRYQLHDLTRAFAVERAEADESPADTTAALERVIHCAVTMIDEATARMPRGSATHISGRPRWHAPDAATMARLVADPVGWFDAERAVFVALVERASELGLVTSSTSLAAALSSSVFTARNQFDQWWQTHSAALQAAEEAGDEASKASLYIGLGRLRLEQDRFDEADDYYGRALAIYEKLADDGAIVLTKLELATVQRERGELKDAERMLVELLPALADAHSPQIQGRAWHSLGMTLTEQGAFEAALVEHNRALARYRELDDRFGQALVHRSIGIAHRAAGDLATAERFCGSALRMLVELGDPHMIIYAMQALAKVRIRQGRGESERQRLLDGLEKCGQLQDGFGQGLLLRTLGELDLAAGRFDDAEQHLQRSLKWWTALALPLWQARTMRDLSTLLAATGRTGEADAMWAEARRLFERHGSHEANEPRPSRAAVNT